MVPPILHTISQSPLQQQLLNDPVLDLQPPNYKENLNIFPKKTKIIVRPTCIPTGILFLLKPTIQFVTGIPSVLNIIIYVVSVNL